MRVTANDDGSVVYRDGVEHLSLGAFAGEERMNFLQRHPAVGSDFDKVLLGFLYAVNF